MKRLICFVLGFAVVLAVDFLPISDKARGAILLVLAFASIAIVAVLGFRGGKHD